jgi:transcriptional regulator with XRE-family HTH domain
MLKQDELMKQPGYWLEMLQNEIFRQVADYIDRKQINQTQLAQELGVSKGYVSQVLKGEFNYTLKKLIELSLAVGKAPLIEFRSLEEVISKNMKQADYPYKSFTEFSTSANSYTVSNNVNVEAKTSVQENMKVLWPIAA